MMKINNNAIISHHELVISKIIAVAWALIALAAFSFLAMRFWPYTMDDSYITYRYSSNLASGHGLVFNPNEFPRAEGIMSPLYAIILSIAPLTGMDIVLLSKWLGLFAAFTTGGVISVLIYRMATTMTHLHPTLAALLSCTGFAYYLSDPYVVGNAVCGMETALSSLSLSLFLLSLFPSPNTTLRTKYVRGLLTGFMAVLVPMFRPEMGLFVVAALGFAYLVCIENRSHIMVSALTFTLVGLVYYSLRFAYYGLPFPLPFYVKQGGLSLSGIGPLKEYLKHEAHLFPMVLVCLCFALGPNSGPIRRKSLFLIPLIIPLAAQVAYFATIHHIMGFGFRYMQPIHVVLVTLSFFGLALFYQMARQIKPVLVLSLPVCFSGLVCLCLMLNIRAYRPAHQLFIDWYTTMTVRGDERAQKIRDAAGGAPMSIAINDCGRIPYCTGFRTIDLAGLNNRAIALHGKSQASKEEIRKGDPDFVVLVSSEPHGQESLKGWERLTNADVIELGYLYAGTMDVAPNYYLLLYVNASRSYDEFLQSLISSNVLDLSTDYAL